MNTYRSAALALVTCAACLSVVACSAGSTTASSSSTGSAAPSVSVSSPASASGPVVPVLGRTLTINGSLRSFPVPAGAKVVENMVTAKAIVIVFGLIAPSDVSRFYATALPQAGYTVTVNSMLSQAGNTGALIQFTGHGYKGNIDSLIQFPDGSVQGLGDKNVTTIIFSST